MFPFIRAELYLDVRFFAWCCEYPREREVLDASRAAEVVVTVLQGKLRGPAGHLCCQLGKLRKVTGRVEPEAAPFVTGQVLEIVGA
jgi:hypothetical protein